MKAMHLIVILSILIAWDVQAQKQLDEMLGIKWGTSRSKAVKIMQSKGFNRVGTKGKKILRYSNGTWDKFDFDTVILHFDNTGFTGGTLFLKHRHEDSVYAYYLDIVRHLALQYGDPEKREDFLKADSLGGQPRFNSKWYFDQGEEILYALDVSWGPKEFYPVLMVSYYYIPGLAKRIKSETPRKK